MNEYISLALGQDPIVYAAGAGAFAAIVLFDAWRTARAAKRTLLGRLLGYAPRVAIPEAENVQTEIADEIQRLKDEFNTALQQMRGDHAEECKQLEQHIADLRVLITQLQKAAAVSDAVLQAKLGAEFADLEQIDGLSADEAKALSLINAPKAG